MIEKAVLPALEDDIICDVPVDQGGEAILVCRGGDLNCIWNDKSCLLFRNGLHTLKWDSQLRRNVRAEEGART